MRVVLSYGRRMSDAYVELLEPGAPGKPAARRELRRFRRTGCNRSAPLPLASGRATVYWQARHCSSRRVAPFAVVEWAGAVAIVTAEPGPYDSLAGMRAIVRALRIREPSDPAR